MERWGYRAIANDKERTSSKNDEPFLFGTLRWVLTSTGNGASIYIASLSKAITVVHTHTYTQR